MAFNRLQYLGRLAGSGTVKCAGEPDMPASYDLEGFFLKSRGLTASGEIRLSAAGLRRVFGRNDVQLLTDDGHLLDLGFAEKALAAESSVADVDIRNGLPSSPQSWSH